MLPSTWPLVPPATFETAIVRAQAASALRYRRDGLKGVLAAHLTTSGPEQLQLDEAARLRLAERLIDALTAAVETGGADPDSREIADLEDLTSRALGRPHVFACTYVCERTALDDLAVDEIIGAVSEVWPLVAQILRRSAFDVLGALTERVLLRPADNQVRDPLTTLIVQPVFDLVLGQEVQRALRHQSPLSIVLLRLDNLEQLHATYGDPIGDLLLERTALIVRRFFRRVDWVGRYGTDSIVSLLPDTRLDAATDLAVRLREMLLARLVVRDNGGRRVPVSLGAAAVGSDAVGSSFEPDQILAAARDAALRAARTGAEVERVVLEPTTVSLIGATNLLGCKSFVVRRLVRTGRVPARKRGGHYHLDRAALEAVRGKGAGSRP